MGSTVIFREARVLELRAGPASTVVILLMEKWIVD
jgi:hypothetical protein